MISAGDKVKFMVDHTDPASTIRSGVVSKVLKDEHGLAYLVRIATGKVVIVLDTQIVRAEK